MAGRRAVDLKWWDGNATRSVGAAHLSLPIASKVVTRLRVGTRLCRWANRFKDTPQDAMSDIKDSDIKDTKEI
ncbi:hypothetical protein E4U43_003847 [Claviceps pusilla]|uniref:Uncharacterized protein n=1 Tax=Claviceps pusilla TaxID=123648 RepID=A0A9P7N6L5_9HYPO|nr:hypothetical protein E4U43_003847 [Claviceps pusilla]